MVQMAQLQKASTGCPWYGDYTPGSDVNAGDVVVSGVFIGICTGGLKVNGQGNRP